MLGWLELYYGAAVISITFYATTVAERRVRQAYLNSEFVPAAGLPSPAAVSPADNKRITTSNSAARQSHRDTNIREGS